jgi:hypothetical protein
LRGCLPSLLSSDHVPLEKIPPTVGWELAEDADDVQRFLGLASAPTAFG